MGVKKRQKRARIGPKRAEKPKALKVKESAKAKKSP
jgi:hypothetical protein